MEAADGRPWRCAITALTTPGAAYGQPVAAVLQRRLREQVLRWTSDGVDFVQLREKQIGGAVLLSLARTALGAIAEVRPEIAKGGAGGTRLLVNGRADIAAAAGAHGVHLSAQAGELTPGQVRQVFARAGLPGCFVSVSCHGVAEAAAAREGGADLLLFGPVFEKRVAGDWVAAGAGLDMLAQICLAAAPVPVLALGGVTAENAPLCRAAGAAGWAGIRPFAETLP